MQSFYPQVYLAQSKSGNQVLVCTVLLGAGGEDDDGLRPPCTDVFFLTFAIKDRASLAKIQDFYHPQIRNY